MLAADARTQTPASSVVKQCLRQAGFCLLQSLTISALSGLVKARVAPARSEKLMQHGDQLTCATLGAAVTSTISKIPRYPRHPRAQRSYKSGRQDTRKCRNTGIYLVWLLEYFCASTRGRRFASEGGGKGSNLPLPTRRAFFLPPTSCRGTDSRILAVMPIMPIRDERFAVL